MRKLEHYGIRGELLKWFKSHLENRKQCVNINGNSSKFSDITTCEVLQGSVLGPLLFLIYINDIYTSAPKVSFNLFADDTCLFCSNKNLKTLEKNVTVYLNNISNWLKANKLILHVKKSHLLTFNINKNNDNNKMQIKLFIDKEKLEQKDTTKYLDIYLDENLTWNKHIEYINCKLNRGIGVLQKIRKFVQEKTLKIYLMLF